MSRTAYLDNLKVLLVAGAILAATSFATHFAFPVGSEQFHLQLSLFPQYVMLFALGALSGERGWLDDVPRRLERRRARARRAAIAVSLVAVALAAGCGGGGGDAVSADECLERWNTGKHDARAMVAGMWRTYALEPPPAASAWVGRSTEDGDRCAVVVTIHPDGGYMVFDELAQDKPGAFETDPDENMKSNEATKKLESANATGAPGGKLMLK